VTGAAVALGDRLDEANRATIRKHYRQILDNGVADTEGSALPGLLADLRANAEAVYGAAPRGRAREGSKA
jgi:hypothetical protein